MIVVPFRSGGKSRLPVALRTEVALAMLADVLVAALPVGPTRVVTDDPEATVLAASLGAATVADPGGGQGPAVQVGLAGLARPCVVVNADLPCACTADLRALVGAAAQGRLALVRASDGTTNALGLPSPGAFAALYGPGSADRFHAHGLALGLEVEWLHAPGLAADVDTLEDLERLGPHAGAHTRALLEASVR